MVEIKRTTPNVKLTKSAETIEAVKKNTTLKIIKKGETVQVVKKEGRTIVKTKLERLALTRKVSTVKITTPALQGVAGPAGPAGPASAGGGGFVANVYFTTINSNVSPYKKISYDFEPLETILTGSVPSDTEQLFRTYLFDGAIATASIDAGVWAVNYRVKVDKTQGVTQLAFEPFLYHTDTTETTLFKAYTDELNNLDFATIRQTSNQPTFFCDPTDRFGVRIYGKTSTGSTIVISTVVGDGNASYFSTPLKLRHNLLRDIQGGKTDEYYHLTASEYDQAKITFEKYNKNLFSYPYTITETSGTITTIIYTTPTGTITKVITEVSPTVTTIVFTGLPAGLPTTKTITEGVNTVITYT